MVIIREAINCEMLPTLHGSSCGQAAGRVGWGGGAWPLKTRAEEGRAPGECRAERKRALDFSLVTWALQGGTW